MTGRGFVINLDDQNGAGTHWTAARLLGSTLYYADPVGTLLNGWPPKSLESIPGLKKIVTNNITFQRPANELCGYYSILFVKAMDKMQKDSPPSREDFIEMLWEAIR